MVLLLAIVSTATAKYSGGSGTAQDPYRIATAGDLIALGATPADYDKHFILTADIDLDPKLPGRKVFDKAVIAADTDQTKDWFQGTSFTGVFDGKGHRISHLTLTGKDYLGLFGVLGPGAQVKNLGVVDVNVKGSGERIGGLVGSNGGSVTLCYSTGAVSGTGNYDNSVGGLVGTNGGSVTRCYSTGVVGATGNYGSVGGLVGDNEGVVTQCYSSGAVSVTGQSQSVGGLAGGSWRGGPVTGCFWDIQVSGQAKSAGGTGKTTTEMQDIRTYRSAGWDFWGEAADGIQEIWQMPQGGGYPVLAVFGGYAPPQLQGQGTAQDPYLIHNSVELGAMVYHSPYAHYRLAAAIDLSGIRWGTAVIPRFAGTFDGNDLTISNLTIEGGDLLGLFGQLAPGGEVKNVGVVGVRITGSGDCIGGLVGQMQGGSLTRCYSTGVVKGTGWGVGGLVGANGPGGVDAGGGGIISTCHSTCETTGGGGVGGLVGFSAYEGIASRCYSTGAVKGTGSGVGGLVGSNRGNVNLCYSTGTVSGRLQVGGLVGWSEGFVFQCYSTGAVGGTESEVGGLVGHDEGYVTQCYSTGATTGKDHVGGLVGFNQEDVMSGTKPRLVTACFWDTQASCQTKSAGGTGKTTAEMQDIQTFLRAGWDFVGESENGTSEIWQIPNAGVYPVLAILNGYVPPELHGLGTADDPYQIATATDLIALSETPADYDKHFVLTADIDLDPKLPGRKVFDKAVIAPDTNPNDTYSQFQGRAFTGVFDGNGHTISHLTIKGEGYLGLFGELGWGAQVKNLGVVDVSISGADNVGGLVGWGGNLTQCYSTGAVNGTSAVGGLVGGCGGNLTRCYSTGRVSGESEVGGLVGKVGRNTNRTVTQCYSTGTVSGKSSVGGLVGSNESSTMTQCYSTAAVSGDDCVGGLVGYNWGNVNLCYSTGAVKGRPYVGGLVGLNGGTVAQCYSTGAVKGTGWSVGGLVGSGPATASFWDTQTSGQATSAAGIGKTTAEMQTPKTFLDAGWDFVGETAHGTEDIWGILEGKEYPRLAWEFWACSPDPANGAADVIQPVTLTWVAARRALAHDVYFGEDETAVANATRASLGIYRGRQIREMAAYDPGVLEWGKIYYWRIDEVNEANPDSPWKGRVWSFTTTDCIKSPGPANHAIDVIQQTMLSWVPGGPGLQYDVYLGKDKDAVASATPGSPGIYRSRQPPGTTTYDPGTLGWGTTYYWRIDGVAEADPRGPWKGSVWSFTTVDFVVSVLDDFESYTNDFKFVAGLLMSTWIPGFLNGTGGGFFEVEQTIFHGGRQSMPMDYNNVKKPWYSEAQRTWATPQGWASEGADALTLYFRGKADNGRQPLYVVIEDSTGRVAVVVHPDAEAVRASEWQKWHIALGDVRAAGVDVAAVKKMVIGVGDRKNPKPGGTGRIYIDDIRLTKPMP